MSLTATRRAMPRLVLGPVLFAFLLIGLGGAGPARAGTMVNTNFGDVAIGGYDPVAYFVKGGAVKGSEDFAHEWLGATGHFATAEYRDLFAANPMKYAPQYGGHCAGGMAMGHRARVDPEAWRIVDGKLYLLYSKRALAAWEKDIPSAVAEADRNWKRLTANLTN